MSLTEDPRLPKASEGSQGFLRPQGGPRETQGGRGQGRVRETRHLSLTEDPKLPKASKGSQGFLRPQRGSRSSGRLRGIRGQGKQEGKGSKWEREAKGTRILSLTEVPRLLKASEGSQGFLEPQGSSRGQGRLRGQRGVGSKGYVMLGFRVTITSVGVKGEESEGVRE